MRIRSIRPEFWSSEDIAAMDWTTRLVFIGLWSYVDDNGVGRDVEKLIVADLFPLEDDPRDTLATVSRSLARLSDGGQITRYTADGRPYLHINAWSKHQRIDKAAKSRYPLPTSDNAEPRETVATPSRDPLDISPIGEGEKGRRGEGEKGTSADADTAPPEPQPVREDVEQICEAIALHVQEQTGKQPAITKKWRDSARLLIDRDGFTLEQITWIIRWVAGHDFWSAVILSAPKLREKFPNLVAQAKRDGAPKVDKAAQMILADRLRREAGTDTPKEIEQ